MTLTLHNKSITYPYDVMEDVLVKVGEFMFLFYFIILDMEEDVKVPLIPSRQIL